jgi:uncharacterized protein (DUF952 family)
VLGSYRPASFETEGFVHCSTVGQVLRVANFLYRGQPDLVVLRIDPARLRSAVRYEPPVHSPGDAPPAGNSERFPHVYGPIDVDAVSEVIDLPPNADGTFSQPASIR